MQSAIDLLMSLIEIPSLSRNEDKAATFMQEWLRKLTPKVDRCNNNVYAFASAYDPAKPTLMLNSHIDTVKPAQSYSFDPFKAFIKDDLIYGLGSNDAGASVVSLAHAFAEFIDKPLNFNLIFAASAEEENSGDNGMRGLLSHLSHQGFRVDYAIVGEPTQMLPAVGERGLVVFDGTAHGKSGHAARNEGINALYIALDDINALRNFKFSRESSTLGPIKITATQMQSGTQHNVVPDICNFVLDVRTTDAYTNEEVAEMLQNVCQSELKPRSTHLRASAISTSHPLTKCAIDVCGSSFVSPTMSDMANMPFPSIKLGPGDSARSHTADEFVRIGEIEDAIKKYKLLIQKYNVTVGQGF